jgi:hypothetical protein
LEFPAGLVLRLIDMAAGQMVGQRIVPNGSHRRDLGAGLIGILDLDLDDVAGGTTVDLAGAAVVDLRAG